MRATLIALLLFAGNALAAERASPPGADGMAARTAPCSACHGKEGHASAGVYQPPIAGKPAGYLYEQLASFRDGRRHNTVMERMLAYLSDDYLRDMANYFAAQPYVPAAPAAEDNAALLARGRELVEHGDGDIPACSACHGATLAGALPTIPGLRGLPLHYLNAQLGAWREGVRRAREPDCMGTIARRLSVDDMNAAALWIASRPAGHFTPAKALPSRLPMQCGAQAPPRIDKAAARNPEPAPLSRGEYLVRAGDCYACHTARGGEPLAGGRPMQTPYGTIYSSNLTPDPVTGLGAWSADDFWRALHEGRSRDGRRLYPAFPYPNFTLVTREDADAMYQYLRARAPVRNETKAPDMDFPYNLSLSLMAWRALYFEPRTFEPDATRSAQWNRGKYLVEGLGHCNACHTRRDRLGGLEKSAAYAGGPIPMLGWDALPLVSRTAPSDEQVTQLEELMRKGTSRDGVATGPMAEVVQHSLQYLTPKDITAIGEYLRALPYRESLGETQRYVSDARRAVLMHDGGALYDKHCADCHGANGEGKPYQYPALAGNVLVNAQSPQDSIETVMYGGYGPSTAAVPRPYGMPAYASQLKPEEIAAVVTYIRGSWGNTASAVAPSVIGR